MHISMFHGKKDDYVQITCHQERYMDRLKSMGWALTPEDLLDSGVETPEETAPEQNNDNIEEYNKIAVMLSKDDVEAYIKDNYGIDLDKRGSLETIKEKALAVINESGRSNT